MTPQEQERRNKLWHLIEHKIFQPASTDDQRKWCSLYVKTLARFWEVDSFSVPQFFPNAKFSLPLPDFAIEYDLSNWVNNPPRASLRMMRKGMEIACHHIDHAYQDRLILQTLSDGNILSHYPNAVSRPTDILNDIRWVLDRYVFHPCAHLHPSPDVLAPLVPADSDYCKCLHEIRFGIGITNPFAALFQYRVNLLIRETPQDIKRAKEAERDRVAIIMTNSILSKQDVSANELFGFKR
jgi:hypothetical protein